MADADGIVAEVARAVGLAEGPAGVRAVVGALARLEPVATRRLSRAAGLPVPIVASICGELRKRRIVADERPARLTPSGRELFGGGRIALADTTCPQCCGRGTIVPDELGPLVRDVARIARAAPTPRFELDQCHCTVETKLRRVAAIHAADALVGKRILLLGDDDLIALAIRYAVSRFGSATTIAQLTVLDIDSGVVAFTRRRLAGAPFRWACVAHDVREPLPSTLTGAFDTVVTDPPYTAEGARLFLSRAAAALDGAGDVFFSFGSRRVETTAAVQHDIVRMGFAIQSLTRDFNSYVGAGVLGGTSHLYHLVATSNVEPVLSGTYEAALYTAQGHQEPEPAPGGP